MGLRGTRTSAWWECHHAASRSEVWVWFHVLAQSCATLYSCITGAEIVLDGERGKILSQMLRWILGPFFSPNCPNSQKASVPLTDVSSPVMPKDKVAQEDGKRWSIMRTPTEVETSQATQGQQPAPSAAAQPAKPLPPSKAFISAQVATVGDRKETLQVQSTNCFYLCISAVSSPRSPSELC